MNIKIERSGMSPQLRIEVANEHHGILLQVLAPDKVAWTALAKWCEQKAIESR